MKKQLFKSHEEFRAWQAKNARGVDEHCMQDINDMYEPSQYPCVMVWSIQEEYDSDIDARYPNALIDVLHFKYIYISHFPVKRIKRGLYVYQVFETSNCRD